MPYVGKDGTIYEGSGPLMTLIPGYGEPSQNGGNYSSGGSIGGPRAPPRPGPRRRNIGGFGSVSSWQPPPCGGGT